MGEIRLPRHRAQGGELRLDEAREIIHVRVRIFHAIQSRVIGALRRLRLRAEQAGAFMCPDHVEPRPARALGARAARRKDIAPRRFALFSFTQFAYDAGNAVAALLRETQ